MAESTAYLGGGSIGSGSLSLVADPIPMATRQETQPQALLWQQYRHLAQRLMRQMRTLPVQPLARASGALPIESANASPQLPHKYLIPPDMIAQDTINKPVARR
jgi:hypothetical protein